MMFGKTNWMKAWSLACVTAAVFAVRCGPAWCQSPAAVAPPPPPEADPIRQKIWQMALPPFDGPHQITGDSIFPPPVNLFQQERDSFRQVKEQQGAVARTTNPLPTIGDAEALRRAGIIIDGRSSDPMVVLGVMLNSTAFDAGLRPGDVVRIHRNPPTSIEAPGQAVPKDAVTILVDLERQGQIRQLSLSTGNSALQTAMRPDTSTR